MEIDTPKQACYILQSGCAKQQKNSYIETKKGTHMTIATMERTPRWCLRVRGGVQLVDTFRVAQGRIAPFFGKDVDTKLKITE